MDNKNKIILSLCGGTGAWEKPYKDNGYSTILLTYPNCDITKTKIKKDKIYFYNNNEHLVFDVDKSKIYGILAAPPCTMFSYARTKAKTPRDFKEGMKCIRACLNIIWSCMEVQQETGKKTLPLKFWALENPYHGFLKKLISDPGFIFNPWEFGDAYKKRTALWGNFNHPKKKFKKIEEVLIGEQIKKHKTNSQVLPKFDYMKSKDIHPEFFGKYDRQTRRSITPTGFAKAFFKANK